MLTIPGWRETASLLLPLQGEPTPHAPDRLSPHAYTPPSAVTARLCLSPALTLSTTRREAAKNGTGTGRSCTWASPAPPLPRRPPCATPKTSSSPSADQQRVHTLNYTEAAVALTRPDRSRFGARARSCVPTAVAVMLHCCINALEQGDGPVPVAGEDSGDYGRLGFYRLRCEPRLLTSVLVAGVND